MDGGKRRASTDWRLTISARTIVAMGISSLLMVLVGTITVGTGQAFLVVMALSFLALIALVLRANDRGSGLEP